MEVQDLMKAKNDCLKKYMDVTRSYLSLSQDDELEDLEKFINHRDSILKIISLYDEKLTTLISQLKTPHEKRWLEQIRDLDHEKDDLLKKIAVMDEAVVKKIEDTRNRIRSEMNQSNVGKKRINKFKSQWVKQSGGGLDSKL